MNFGSTTSLDKKLIEQKIPSLRWLSVRNNKLGSAITHINKGEEDRHIPVIRFDLIPKVGVVHLDGNPNAKLGKIVSGYEYFNTKEGVATQPEEYLARERKSNLKTLTIEMNSLEGFYYPKDSNNNDELDEESDEGRDSYLLNFEELQQVSILPQAKEEGVINNQLHRKKQRQRKQQQQQQVSSGMSGHPQQMYPSGPSSRYSSNYTNSTTTASGVNNNHNKPRTLSTSSTYEPTSLEESKNTRLYLWNSVTYPTRNNNNNNSLSSSASSPTRGYRSDDHHHHHSNHKHIPLVNVLSKPPLMFYSLKSFTCVGQNLSYLSYYGFIKLCPNIRVLNLSFNKLDDTQIIKLSQFRNLERLFLYGNKVSDLSSVAQFLQGFKQTNDGLSDEEEEEEDYQKSKKKKSSIIKHPRNKLEILDLRNNPITEKYYANLVEVVRPFYYQNKVDYEASLTSSSSEFINNNTNNKDNNNNDDVTDINTASSGPLVEEFKIYEYGLTKKGQIEWRKEDVQYENCLSTLELSSSSSSQSLSSLSSSTTQENNNDEKDLLGNLLNARNMYITLILSGSESIKWLDGYQLNDLFLQKYYEWEKEFAPLIKQQEEELQYQYHQQQQQYQQQNNNDDDNNNGYYY